MIQIKRENYLAEQQGSSMQLKTSDFMLLSATLISFVLSVSLWFMVNHEAGIFVGLWVPSILAAGCYVKSLNGKT